MGLLPGVDIGIGVGVTLGTTKATAFRGAMGMSARVHFSVRKTVTVKGLSEFASEVGWATMRMFKATGTAQTTGAPVFLRVFTPQEIDKLAYVPGQTLVVMNSDLTALQAQVTALKTARAAATAAGVNSRDIQLMNNQILHLAPAIRNLQARIKRAS